jgi:glycyl-tRNA synthetase beta chain
MAGERAMLLLEIGTEELPASFVNPAGAALLRAVQAFLCKSKVESGEGEWFGTPRRIGFVLEDVATGQARFVREVQGPPVRIAFEVDGTPKPAATKFAESLGLTVDALERRDTEKGEYLFGRKEEGGAETKALLEDAIPGIIASLSFPKSMRWSGDFQFARPIRWIAAILGERTLEFGVADVRSGDRSRGHRLLSPDAFTVTDPRAHLETLEGKGVVADFEKRRNLVWDALVRVARTLEGRPQDDPDLLDEVTNLVEYPGVVVGSYDPAFLELPAPVVVTAMKEHQKYFAVVNGKGELMPHFLAVINNRETDSGEIVAGHEKVLRARLDDARFYFEEDIKKKLDDRVDELKGVVWREGLGTMYDKTTRIRDLSLELAKSDGDADPKVLERAALLCKVDLTTEMIRDGKEFTKLEGIIGREYALHQGEDPRVARVIAEHLLPRFSGDRSPEAREAGYLGMADRLDSLSGSLKSGYEFSGSQDPLGTRKSVYGMIALILDLELRLDLGMALSLAGRPFDLPDPEVSRGLSFIFSRFETYLEERLGVRYDLVDCAIGSGSRDLVNLKKRALGLNDLMEKENEVFTDVAVGQKRAANILEKAETLPEVDESRFETEEEQVLLRTTREVHPVVLENVNEEEFNGALLELLELRGPIDTFFDNVFVMAEDRAVRTNRLALLRDVRNTFHLYGDFSKIVVETPNPSD